MCIFSVKPEFHYFSILQINAAVFTEERGIEIGGFYQTSFDLKILKVSLDYDIGGFTMAASNSCTFP